MTYGAENWILKERKANKPTKHFVGKTFSENYANSLSKYCFYLKWFYLKKKKKSGLLSRRVHTKLYEMWEYFLILTLKRNAFNKIIYFGALPGKVKSCAKVRSIYMNTPLWFTHQKRLAWKSSLCRFPQFQSCPLTTPEDADLLKSTDFCLWFSFYGRKRLDNPIRGQPNQEDTPSLKSKALERFLNLYPQTLEF